MHLSYRTVYRTIRTSRIGAGCIPFRRDALRIGLWALCRTNLVNKKLIIIYLLIQVLILRKFLLKYLLMTCHDFYLIKIDYIFWLYRLFSLLQFTPYSGVSDIYFSLTSPLVLDVARLDTSMDGLHNDLKNSKHDLLKALLFSTYRKYQLINKNNFTVKIIK